MNETLQKIQELLDERDWSLYRLAKESGIPYASLSSLFQKNNQPTVSTLRRICAGFDISMAEFFSDDTPYRKPEIELSTNEKDMIKSYRNLNRTNKKIILEMMKVLNNIQ